MMFVSDKCYVVMHSLADSAEILYIHVAINL